MPSEIPAYRADGYLPVLLRRTREPDGRLKGLVEVLL
jgi:hypothetical protein